MNISQELHKELVFFLKKQNDMKDSELEILFLYNVFRNINKQNRIKETMFKNLIKIYKNNKLYNLNNTNSLDIIHSKDENNNIRFTVTNLKKFLISSNLDKYISTIVEKSKINRKTSNINTLSKDLIIGNKKESIIRLQKTNNLEQIPYSINYVYGEYKIRINLKKEKIRKADNKEIKNIISKFQKKEYSKFIYRLKNRYSFSNELFQVDLTAVKQFICKDSNIEWSKLVNLLINTNVRYEIEVEILKKNISKTAIKKIMECLMTNISIILKSEFPISKKLTNIIMNEYQTLINTTNISNWINNLKPKTFDWNFIENDTDKYLLTKYAVTDKADGENYKLFVNHKHVYLINSIKENVIFTGIILKNDKYNNLILDGELILNDKEGNDIFIFKVFDIYYDGKKVLFNYNLLQRLNIIKKY